MHLLRQGIPWLFLSVVGAASASAQAPLTFEEATAQALARNPTLQAARARADRAAADADVARSAWFPRLTFTETAQHSNQPAFVFASILGARRFTPANFEVDALNHPAALTMHQFSAAMEQVLFDGGRTAARARTARLQRDLATLSTNEEAADLIVALAEQYGRVLMEDERRQALEASVRAAAEDLARAERQRDAGRATDADVLAMSAHLADVRQQEIAAAGEAAAARAQVNRLRGTAADAEFAAIEPTPSAADDRSLSTLVGAAADSRAELAKARLSEQLARTAESNARADWWPRAAGRIGVESTGLTFRDRSAGWAAGIELQWAISLGGAEIARTRAAQAQLAEARAALAAAQSAVEAEIVAARERHRAAQTRLDAARAAVAQARESERIVRDRYDAGMAATNDVLRAAALVLDTETARIGGVVDAFVARIRFDRAIGRRSF
jgi:outer membrane protein TolC